MFFKMRKSGPQKPVPFIEEKTQEIPKNEEVKMEPRKEPDVLAEEHKVREVDRRPIGDACYNGHPLYLSNSDENFPGGYYICTNCQQVFKCSSGYWICGECPIYYCLNCKVPDEDAMRELAAQRLSNDNSQDKSERQDDVENYHEHDPVQQERRSDQIEDTKEKGGPESVDIFGNYLMNMVNQVIASDQAQNIPEFRKERSGGKVIWTKTHFVFLIDCSRSMAGSRWNSVKTGFEDCLYKLKEMKDIIVTGLTFDSKPNPFCHEKTPTEAIKAAKDMPFTGSGTSYKRALEYTSGVIKKSNYKDHLVCIILLSDGLGGYPDRVITEFKEMMEKGRKFLFYTIACENNEDNDMMRMAEELNGEHFKVDSPEAIKVVFSNILAV